MPVRILDGPEPKGRGGGCRSPRYQIPQQTGAGLLPVTISAPACPVSLRPRPTRPVLVASFSLDLAQDILAGCRSRRGSFVV